MIHENSRWLCLSYFSALVELTRTRIIVNTHSREKPERGHAAVFQGTLIPRGTVALTGSILRSAELRGQIHFPWFASVLDPQIVVRVRARSIMDSIPYDKLVQVRARSIIVDLKNAKHIIYLLMSYYILLTARNLFSL